MNHITPAGPDISRTCLEGHPHWSLCRSSPYGGTVGKEERSSTSSEIWKCFRHCSRISKFVISKWPELLTFLKKLKSSIVAILLVLDDGCNAHCYPCWVFCTGHLDNCILLGWQCFCCPPCYDVCCIIIFTFALLPTLELLIFIAPIARFFQTPDCYVFVSKLPGAA